MRLPERPLPHNVEAEQAVLGAIFIRPSIWPAVQSHLRLDEFFIPGHREVYDAMAAVADREMPLDLVTVGDELRARGMLPRLEGGEDYLMTLADSVPTAENVDHYVRIVRTTGGQRELIRLGGEIASRAYGNVDLERYYEEIARSISGLAVRSAASELSLIGDSVQAVLDEIEARSKGEVQGVFTGIAGLDALTCGFLPEELVIIGADPGAGKSALAEQAGLRLCIEEGGTCFYGTLEMSKNQLTERALAHLAEVNSFYLRSGKVSLNDARDLYDSGAVLRKLRFYVDAKITSVREFAAQARVWRARHPNEKALAIFDFLQLAGGGQGQNRAQQVGNDARELKALAKELKVAIIGVSSLNRDTKDNEKPPSKKSLKESGDVEFAADFVVLIWNKDGTKDGPVTLICDKSRNGAPGGWVQAHWIGRHYKFCDVDRDDHHEQQQMPLTA